MSFAPVLGIDPTAVSDTAEFLLGQHGAVVGSPPGGPPGGETTTMGVVTNVTWRSPHNSRRVVFHHRNGYQRLTTKINSNQGLTSCTWQKT